MLYAITGLDWTIELPLKLGLKRLHFYDIEYSLKLTIQYSRIISLLFKMSEQQLRIILYLLYLSKSFSLKSNN